MNNILETGDPLSEEVLVALEQDLKLRLPDDYRLFLLKTNGGRPAVDVVDVPGLPGGSTDLQTFFGVNRPIKTSNIAWNAQLLSENNSGPPMVPIACDSGGGLFCLRTMLHGFDAVYLELGSHASEAHVVAPSFGNFLQKLRPWKDY
jgi:hypothetical protein